MQNANLTFLRFYFSSIPPPILWCIHSTNLLLYFDNDDDDPLPHSCTHARTFEDAFLEKEFYYFIFLACACWCVAVVVSCRTTCDESAREGRKESWTGEKLNHRTTSRCSLFFFSQDADAGSISPFFFSLWEAIAIPVTALWFFVLVSVRKRRREREVRSEEKKKSVWAKGRSACSSIRKEERRESGCHGKKKPFWVFFFPSEQSGEPSWNRLCIVRKRWLLPLQSPNIWKKWTRRITAVPEMASRPVCC